MPTLELPSSSLSAPALAALPAQAPSTPAVASNSTTIGSSQPEISAPSSSNSSSNEANKPSSSTASSEAAATTRTSSSANTIPVIAAQWVATGTAGAGRVDIQLPRQVIGANGPEVLIQLPPQAAAITNAAGNASVRLSNLDNAPAPSWVQYSPQSGGLVIGKVPAGSLPTQIKMTVGNAQVTVQINAPGE